MSFGASEVLSRPPPWAPNQSKPENAESGISNAVFVVVFVIVIFIVFAVVFVIIINVVKENKYNNFFANIAITFVMINRLSFCYRFI